MSQREFDVVSGQASFDKLKDSLLAILPEKLINVNADVEDAANAALNLVDYMRKDNRMALVGKIPAEIAEKNLDDKLESIALAAKFIALQATKEGVASTNVKVDIEVVNKAIEVRKRMIRTIRYALDDKSTVMREVDDIEAGSGYEDMANDLVRVVDIYLAHKKAVTIDKKNYRSTDVAEAQKLVVAIRSEIRAFAAKESPFADLKKRAFTELSRLYKELRAAGRYVFRNRQDIVDDLTPLRVAMGIIFSRRTAPVEEKTGETKPEPKGEAKPKPEGEAKPAPKGEAKPKPEDAEDDDE